MSEKRGAALRILVLAGAFVALGSLPCAAQEARNKVLYVYDEVNEQSEPYIANFRSALAAAGVSFDEVTAADLAAGKTSVNPASYDRVLIHGMVMAFNGKSPVRDWLKKKPALEGTKVSLFVTANRWFLDKLFAQLTGLVKKDGGELVDAVSMATKDTTDAEEKAAVEAQVARFAGK